MQGRLSQASLAFIWDHCIAGQALFPAAAMLEAASAAVASALGSAAEGQTAALVAVSIPSPLPLPPFNGFAVSIAAVVDPVRASLSIESQADSRGVKRHLQCGLTHLSSKPPATDIGLEENVSNIGAALKPLLLYEIKKAPAACGVVCARPALQGQEYLCDPAVLDNGTQVWALASNFCLHACTAMSSGISNYAMDFMFKSNSLMTRISCYQILGLPCSVTLTAYRSCCLSETVSCC